MQRYVNQVAAPKDQPLRPPGVTYPVILRLVLADGSEEWRPGKSVKWTRSAVLVGWEAQPGDHRSVEHAWLPTEDVRRVIRRPAHP